MNRHLEIARYPGFVELILNRPAVLNALSISLIAELTSEIQKAADDAAIRSIILTGAPPAFCAGLDLNEVAAAGPHYDSSPLLNLFETIENLSKPVIAAVGGAAAAGGAALASVCDVAICAASARISYPGVKRGLIAPIVMSYLCRLVGERHARYLVLTGESIPAAQALAMGLVDEVVAEAELMPRARQVAGMFAAHPAAALAQTKRLFGTLRRLAGDPAAARSLNSTVTAGHLPPATGSPPVSATNSG